MSARSIPAPEQLVAAGIMVVTIHPSFGVTQMRPYQLMTAAKEQLKYLRHSEPGCRHMIYRGEWALERQR